ncbi:hypothetical protein [Aeromicrobium fastidiosum]|uniref:hypothetical protein n=1 Tax=Aeromicrobium fastidiosum TaxID=52699 RepID=UPI001D69E1DC|nr:hypothetical protein [Aeromicrobium fastidiosum]MBP2391702.1 hypothetical protein [Aeromicrobium fastidiosum]
MHRRIDPTTSLRLTRHFASGTGAVDEVQHVDRLGSLERGQRLTTHDHLLDDLPIFQHPKTPAVSTFLPL